MHFPEGVKVPTGFSVNVKKLVSMKDLSITHCKAHDYRVMLTVFLPIAIRAIKPEFLKICGSCDADSVSSYCNQGYNTLHVLLLFKDLTEDDWQERAEWPT